MLRAKTKFRPEKLMDTLRIEPRASRMLSRCDTTTPCAPLWGSFGRFLGSPGPGRREHAGDPAPLRPGSAEEAPPRFPDVRGGEASELVDRMWL